MGHKLLLSLAAYCTSERLVCGVSDAPLLKKKSCRELMQPVALRMALVDDFLHSIKPSIKLELSALQDGYGPATRDAALQAIVVSAESAAGGAACNARRQEGAHSGGVVLPPLRMITMPLVAEDAATLDVSEETKVSSTDARKAQLGVLRGSRGGGSAWCRVGREGSGPPEEEHWCRRSEAHRPYVLGLSGGIAAGKSTARKMLVEIAKEMEGMTLEAVDCDALAHEAYLPGTAAFAQLAAEFGDIIVTPEGNIDRKALGALVFAEDGGVNMKRLTDIAWPATAALAEARIAASKADVVVMEAAVLLEAGWDHLADEIWVISAPPAKVIERLAERNGLSTEEAEQRMAKQMTPEQRIARCHVPLSSTFGEAATRAQLRNALEGARRRRQRTLAAQPPTSAAGTFHSLCVEAGVAEGHAARWWGIVRDGMDGVGRYYHDMRHVEDMLHRVAALEADGLLSRPSLVRFAIFFHDLVYDATAKDNEARSADQWRAFAKYATALPPADVEAVAAYILRTAHHMDGPASGDLACFLDTDLAVLGRSPAEYAEYTRQVRLEYAHMLTPDFVAGRAQFCAAFLQHDRLYFANEAERDLSGLAAENLTQEKARLMRRLEKH